MKIAIAGYGNLGKAVQKALEYFTDFELVGIFTRRDVSQVDFCTQAPVYSFEDITKFTDKIDVVLNCMGSATDLPYTTPLLANNFNVIDTFDTHSVIKNHYDLVDSIAKQTGHTAMISIGWDPGLFSLNRLFMRAILPVGKDYTFWGDGVSQGHSDAIRHIFGVVDAKQYTVPIQSAVYKVRSGQNEDFTARQMHKRVCYVAANEGADLEKIEQEIKSMPNYFADYDTEVNFIDYESFLIEHEGLKHAGTVIRNGETPSGTTTVEYSLNLASNPEFTANIMLCYARALLKMHQAKHYGAYTIFDVKPKDLIGENDTEIYNGLL
ncbi:MAG: diaminopimelate dehydrogenase [Clostridia bacterium]